MVDQADALHLGAGTTIPSVRHFSQRVVLELGGRLIRVNPDKAGVPIRLNVGQAGALLPSQRDRTGAHRIDKRSDVQH